MKLVVTALFRAILTQLHPRMLWLAVWPFLTAAVFWGALGFYFRESILSALHDLLFGLELTRWIEGTFRFFGIEGILVVIVPVLYIALLLALAVVTALLIIGIFAMPSIVEHISTRNFPQLARKEGGSRTGGAVNATVATAIFLVGWVVTMPFWLVLPMAVVLPWLWWAWLSTRILRYDALLRHATAEERHALYARHRVGFFVIGLCVAALNFVPPLFFFAPIFGGIAFTQFALRALEELRATQVSPAGGATEGPVHTMAPEPGPAELAAGPTGPPSILPG